jgi:hypothetical protein
VLSSFEGIKKTNATSGIGLSSHNNDPASTVFGLPGFSQIRGLQESNSINLAGNMVKGMPSIEAGSTPLGDRGKGVRNISIFGAKKRQSDNRKTNLNQTNEEIYRWLDPEEEKTPNGAMGNQFGQPFI